MLEAKGDPKNEADALRGAQTIDFNLAGDPAHPHRYGRQGRLPCRRHPGGARRPAGFPAATSWPIRPGGSPGAVMDGRDIGTVICPTATAKLYVDARPEVRARRRWPELKAMGIRRDEGDLLRELNARDAADKTRPISPLNQAPDAALLDTSDLGIDAAFAAALALVSPKVEGALKDRHRG